MMGRPKALLELTSDEKEQLERWVRRRKSAQGLALRSQIVLSCATGLTNKEVAAQLGISMPTVGKWRSRFIDSRLDGLVDEPRSGRKPTITAEQVGGRGRRDVGVDPRARHPLVPQEDGRTQRTVEVHHRPDLERVRPQTAPLRRVQTVQRPLVRGQDLRRGRALLEPAGIRGGVVRG